MLTPWIIHTLTLPPLLASLVLRNFRRYHKPTIYLPQNSHHTYLLWHFHSHSEIYCHATFHRSVYYDTLHYCHIAFAWSCSWHPICGKATIHDSFIHVTLDSLHIPVHRRRHSYRVIFCSKYRVVILSCKVNKSVMIFIIRALSQVRKGWWRLWYPHKSGWDSGRKKRGHKK